MVMFFFSVLDLSLQVLFKKSIWHFNATGLISLQLIRRDLMPVACLVYVLSTCKKSTLRFTVNNIQNILYLIDFWADSFSLIPRHTKRFSACKIVRL